MKKDSVERSKGPSWSSRRETYAAKVDESDFKKYTEAQYERMNAAEEAKLIKASEAVLRGDDLL